MCVCVCVCDVCVCVHACVRVKGMAVLINTTEGHLHNCVCQMGSEPTELEMEEVGQMWKVNTSHSSLGLWRRI